MGREKDEKLDGQLEKIRPILAPNGAYGHLTAEALNHTEALFKQCSPMEREVIVRVVQNREAEPDVASLLAGVWRDLAPDRFSDVQMVEGRLHVRGRIEWRRVSTTVVQKDGHRLHTVSLQAPGSAVQRFWYTLVLDMLPAVPCVLSSPFEGDVVEFPGFERRGEYWVLPNPFLHSQHFRFWRQFTTSWNAIVEHNPRRISLQKLTLAFLRALVKADPQLNVEINVASVLREVEILTDRSLRLGDGWLAEFRSRWLAT